MVATDLLDAPGTARVYRAGGTLLQTWGSGLPPPPRTGAAFVTDLPHGAQAYRHRKDAPASADMHRARDQHDLREMTRRENGILRSPHADALSDGHHRTALAPKLHRICPGTQRHGRMLIKQSDDYSPLLSRLEHEAAGSGKSAQFAAVELRRRKAGIKGERESAYLIDFDFGASSNWAVIHDLRLVHNGRTAQIDHLLINRWMDVYVLETKHFHSGIKITEEGEFLRWNDFRKTYEGMPSPLEQNDRHILVLRDAMASLTLPTRLGFSIPPAFQQFVLVAPGARISRPENFDTRRVIKADQLRKAIWRDVDNENALLGILRTAAKLVSSETVEAVARQLAAMHQPAADATPATEVAVPVLTSPIRASAAVQARIEPTLPPKFPEPQASALPACKACGGRKGEICYGKFGYYLKCDACQANTAIRFTCQPGHAPRLRKAGQEFYRDCAQCGSSDLVHRNAGNQSA